MYIFNWIAALLAKRKAAKADELFQRGYDWAAGELLRGKATDEIRMHTEAAFDFDTSNAFDYGAEAAITAWRALSVDIVAREHKASLIDKHEQATRGLGIRLAGSASRELWLRRSWTGV